MAKRKKKAKKAAKRKTSKAAGEMIVVQSKFKEALKAHGMNVASDAVDGANGIFHWYIAQAAKRAQMNGRKTVRAHDFMA